MQCTFDRPQQRRPRRSKTSTSSVTNSMPVSESEISNGHSADTTVLHGRSDSQGSIHTHSLNTSISATEPTLTFSSGSTLMKVGSREALGLMIKDYLDLLYPLMPIVHRPNFRADVDRERGEHDPIFYSLLLSICALVVSQLPRRFLEYKTAQWFFEFNTPKQLVMHLEERICGLRSREYFESPTV